MSTPGSSQRSKEFYEAVASANLRDVIGIPFYLVRLVEVFRAKGGLPPNKAELFQELILAALNEDERHFRTTTDLRSRRQERHNAIERLAIGMETLARNYITDSELRHLIPEADLRSLLRFSTLANRNEQEGEETTWHFQHNNFQEYLAATVLSRQTLAVVKAFMSLDAGHTRMNPSWTNTLSFLTSILHKTQPLFTGLLGWVKEIGPHLAVRFERDKLDRATRVDIFKYIFNDYKQNRTRIDGNKYPYDELARFGQSVEIVDFLLEEAQGECTHSVANAVELLGLMAIPLDRKEHVTEVLTELALGHPNQYVQNGTLIALGNAGLVSREVVDRLVPGLRNSTNDWIRFGLYYLLHRSEYLDENIDVFLEGIKYLGFHASGQERESRLFDEQWHLGIGLEKATAPEALHKILCHFKDKPMLLDTVRFKRSLPQIAENAAKAYPREPKIFELVLGLVKALVASHFEEEGRTFVRFFDSTRTRSRAFQESFPGNKGDPRGLRLLATLADQTSIEFFADQYQQGNLTDPNVWTFHNHLTWLDQNLADKFNQLINQKSGNRFAMPPRRDYEQERKEASARDMQLIFDRAAFLQEVREIFDLTHKHIVNREDLIDFEMKYWDKPPVSRVVMRELSNLAERGPVSFESATQMLRQRDWGLFCAREVYKYYDSYRELHLTQAQRNMLGKWSDSQISAVDFKTVLITDPDGRIHTSEVAVYLWFYLRKLDLEYPGQVLLDMLSFDWPEGFESVGIEYLEQKLSPALMEEKILNNLRAGIKNDNVLRNHIDYCRRHRIQEVVSFALDVIADSKRREDIRRLALDTVLELCEEPTSLEGILAKITDDFRWRVVEELLDRDSTPCHDFLSQVFRKKRGPQKQRAAEYLLRLQDMKALRYYVTHIRRQKRFTQTRTDDSPLLSLRSRDAVPLLIQLLKATYEEDFVQDEWHRLDQVVLTAFERIALQSDEDFAAVKTRLQNLIRRHGPQHESMYGLNAYLERLEDRFYLNKSQTMTIADVVQKLSLLQHNTP